MCIRRKELDRNAGNIGPGDYTSPLKGSSKRILNFSRRRNADYGSTISPLDSCSDYERFSLLRDNGIDSVTSLHNGKGR